jgi:hypothetical protein
MPELVLIREELQAAFDKLSRKHNLRLEFPSPFAAMLANATTAIELTSSPQDEWLSGSDIVGSLNGVRMRLHLDYVLTMRSTDYQREMQSGSTSAARLRVLAAAIECHCDDILRGDLSQIIEQERYLDVAEILNWAFVPGNDAHAKQAYRHPRLVLKHKSNDATWIRDYYELVVLPALGMKCVS